MPADAPEEIEDLFDNDHRRDHLKTPPLDPGPQEGPSDLRSEPIPVIKTEVRKRTAEQVHANEIEFLTDIQVAQRYGISRSTVWRWKAQKNGFPAPLVLSPGTTRWSLNALRNFEETRAELAQRNMLADTKSVRPASSRTSGGKQ